MRRLVLANQELLAGLDADDRQRVEAAIATARTSRATLDATFPAIERASQHDVRYD